MPRIIIDNLASKAIESEDKSKKLLQVLLEHIDWMHTCGGKGRCTTCKVVVKEGLQHFDSISHAEQKFIDLNKLQLNEQTWIETVQGFSKGFHDFVGPEAQLKSLCKKQNKQWVKSMTLL